MPSTSEVQHSANPLGSAAADEDQVGLAANAMATGIATAVLLFSGVAWGTIQLTAASGVTDVSEVKPSSLAVNFVAFGSTAAVFAVALMVWFLLAPVRSNFRRGGVAMAAALGGTVVAFLATLAARWALASQGLIGLMVLAGLVAAYFAKRTRAAAMALPSAHLR